MKPSSSASTRSVRSMKPRSSSHGDRRRIARGPRRARFRRARRPRPAADRGRSGSSRHEMRAGFLEVGLALGIDQADAADRESGCRDRSRPRWRCASTKIAQPEPRRRKALLSRRRRRPVRPATAESRSGPRNFAVRWKLPSLFSTTPSSRPARPRAGSRRGGWRLAIFGEVHHGRALTPRDGRGCADAGAHLDEERIALGRPDGREMADGPDGEADQPEAQAEADGPASVPLRMAMARGAPPSRMCSVSARWTGTRSPAPRRVSKRPAIRRAPRRRTRRTTGRSSTRRRRSTGRRRSGSACGSRPTCRRRPASGR
jgi:hypothetical protein